LQDMVMQFSGIEIEAINSKVESTFIEGDYLISAVDNMAVRKNLYEHCTAAFLIDPRMGAEYATMQVVNFNSDAGKLDGYEKSLYADKDAEPERCTAKATVYTAMLIAGQICKAVKDTSMGLPYVASLEWSIANNSLLAFDRDGRKI
jgi:molybdopterin/thiamine biosynthesis adenylyltransferase